MAFPRDVYLHTELLFSCNRSKTRLKNRSDLKVQQNLDTKIGLHICSSFHLGNRSWKWKGGTPEKRVSKHTLPKLRGEPEDAGLNKSSGRSKSQFEGRQKQFLQQKFI